MKRYAKESIFFAIAGSLSIALCFVGAEMFNTFTYRVALGNALVALTISLILALTIALLRTWSQLSKCIVAMLVIVLHPFTNRIWLDNQALTIAWVVLAGYLCVDSKHPKRFVISLVFALAATPFTFFENLTMVAFWILAANGLVHAFLNRTTLDRFCSFFLGLASISAAISFIPAFAGSRLGMIPALFVLCWGFFDPEFRQMAHIRLENETIFQRERTLARIEERALKEEIRPHFLLNALNNVQVAYHSSPEEGRDLLNALIRLETKVVAVSQADTVPLQQEISISQDLIALFEFERKHPVAFNVDISDPYLPIPPMLLEPLVENSLQHSGVLKQDDGAISLRQWSDHGFATIVLSDNGTERPLPSPSRGIGLNNVQRRVGLLDEGKMSVYSDQDGTYIEITFRLKEEREENGAA